MVAREGQTWSKTYGHIPISFPTDLRLVVNLCLHPEQWRYAAGTVPRGKNKTDECAHELSEQALFSSKAHGNVIII